LYKLSNSFPYLLNRVGVRMGEVFSRRIASYGISLPMYRVLAALSEMENQRLSDLGAMTSIEVSTLSRLIGEMKSKALVTRSRPRDNGRTVAINLTTKGRAVADELRPIAINFEEIAVSAFEGKDLERLKKALNSIYENLETIAPEIQPSDSRATRVSKRKTRQHT
jgi:DNA-binding MarR family transcriptional regulator